MLSEQFSDEEGEPPKPEEGEPANQSQDPAPAQEGEDKGASAAQGPEPEADSQEQVHPKTGCERGDGPDVQEMGLPNPEEVKMTEERRQSIRHENCKVSVSTSHYAAQAGILWLLMNNSF
ncbi:G antigen 1-like [Theropithecus gelada]|uniref:G antigen 1-like n=1 Tax=Theropithecus gelada TaxID=9565 RepID=UPI000DC1ADD6|nr:G antigen 1-like [Theropithecus gelada]